MKLDFRLIFLVGVLSALMVAIGSWNAYSRRFARFPVHRLPDVLLFDDWKEARTRADLAAIRKALDGYMAHYGHLPFNSPNREYQFSITMGHDLNGLLTDIERRNPKEIVFWNVPAGEQRDGWGRCYHYYFDHDGDHRINTGKRVITGDYFVWSDGPNETDDGGTSDDLY